MLSSIWIQKKIFKVCYGRIKKWKNYLQFFFPFCIDAIYKVLKLGLPVYVMVCVDSNGQTEVVVAWIFVSETVSWMMDTFKKHNTKWKRIRVIMANKDISKRDVIKGSIPDAAVLIYLFHTLWSLIQEIIWESLLFREVLAYKWCKSLHMLPQKLSTINCMKFPTWCIKRG